MTRRSLLSSLIAVPLVAQEKPALALNWYRCAVNQDQGVLVQVQAFTPDVRAFEVSIQWRHDFLGEGQVQEKRILVARQDGPSSCEVITGGGEAWVQVQAWGLRQHEYAISSRGIQ